MKSAQNIAIELQQQDQKIQQLEKQLKEKTNINQGKKRDLKAYGKQTEELLEQYRLIASNSPEKGIHKDLYDKQRWDWIDQMMDLDKAEKECQEIEAELNAAKEQRTLIEQQLAAKQAQELAAKQAQELAAKQAQEQKRTKLIGELKSLLLSYQTQRNQHYILKDVIAPDDKKTRDAFIDSLKIRMDQVITANEAAEAIVTELTKSITDFHGIKMKATLNKIIVKLMELGSDIDTETVSHDRAKEKLGAQQEEHTEYVNSINELYEQIKKMSDYGNTLSSAQKEVITVLTEALNKDVDIFVCQNESALPDEKAYNDFKTKFTARLHSEDDIMSKHAKDWKVKTANVVIGIISVGIVLGFQLAYSKLKNHRATLFFDKTTKQKAIEAIDSALGKIPGPSASE